MATTYASIQGLATQWEQWAVSSLISTAVVITVVAGIWFFALRNRSPQLACMLFFLVLIKPFVPISINVPQQLAKHLPFVSVDHPIKADHFTESVVASANESVPKNVQPWPVATSAADIEATVTQSPLIDQAPAQTEAVGLVSASTASRPAERELPASDSNTVTPFSYWTIPFFVYCVILLGLLWKFLTAQIGFHRRVSTGRSLSSSDLPIDFAAACKLAGLRRIPRVVEMETDSPAVWGLISPTLILPRGLATELPTSSFRWIVMHELAHLRRHDLALHAIQRILTIFQFWNPFAWIATAMIGRTREQACDDMALIWSQCEPIAASEAFLHIVRSSNRRPRLSEQLAASLGVFSSASKRACSNRLSRLLDFNRPLSDRMGIAAVVVLIVTATGLLPRLRAVAQVPASDPPQVEQTEVETEEVEQTETNSSAEFVPADSTGTFELIVVGPDEKPIPDASVEIRPRINSKWQLLKGKHKEDGTYGVYTQTDQQGRLKVKLPDEKLRALNFSIKAPGYGLFWAQWEMGRKSETLPAAYTARLDAGQTVGGIIVDPQGEPIVGAKVHPSIEYKKRETDESQLRTGWRATTDQSGRWQCPYVPQSYQSLSVQIVHPDYPPTYQSLTLPKYSVVPGTEPSESITIKQGIILKGRIADQNDRPIKGAKIRLVAANETRVATSDENGVYRMPGCPLGKHAVTVTAKTFAPDQKLITFASKLADVDFKLAPGNTIRIRVVDADGNPQAKARIFFRRWREDTYGKGLGTVHSYTDENGVWEWNEAPADSFIADICPQGGLQIDEQTLIARNQDYVFKATPELKIVGSVTDAQTGQPIDSFRVIPGMVWNNREIPSWFRRESFDARDGKFTYKQDRMDGLHAIRIEADGFVSASSRHIKVDEGNVELKFSLKPAEPLQVKLSQPDGRPAVGASALLGVMGTQIQVENGKFDSGTFGKQVTSDDSGTLVIPAEGAAMRLVVLHESGYADQYIEAGKTIDSIKLIAWARVRGTLWQGDKPASQILLRLSPRQSQPAVDVPHVSWQDRATTNAKGEFEFATVRPGDVSLFRSISSHNTGQSMRSKYSHRRNLQIEPGQIQEIELDKAGFQVRGKAIAQVDSAADVEWEFSTLKISPVLGERPSAPVPEDLSKEERAKWFDAWNQTEAGRAYQKQRRAYFLASIQEYLAKISDDGSFVVYGIPPGKYNLSIQLDARPKAGSYEYPRLGTASINLDLSETDSRPVDLGDVIVK